MWIPAWNSLWREVWFGISLSVSWMGTTVLGILVTGPIASLCVLGYKRICHGIGPMKEHWKKITGIGFGVGLFLWVMLVFSAIAATIYDDHQSLKRIASQRLIKIQGRDGDHGLIGENNYLKKQIDGPDGYKQQLAAAKAETHDIQGRLDDELKRKSAVAQGNRLQPSAPSSEDDSDHIYQLGNVVGTVIQPLFVPSRSEYMFAEIYGAQSFDETQAF